MRIARNILLTLFAIIIFLLLVKWAEAQTVFVVPPGQSLQMDISKDAHDNTIITVYNAPQLPPPPPPFTAQICPMADVVGHYSVGSDGMADFCIQVDGLKAAVSNVSITNDNNGLWRSPQQEQNFYWIVAQSDNKFYFSYYASSRFHIKIGYANGTFDEADVQ